MSLFHLTPWAPRTAPAGSKVSIRDFQLADQWVGFLLTTEGVIVLA